MAGYEHGLDGAVSTLMYPEATQDIMEVHDIASTLLEREWVLMDFDDTIVTHDPRAQYWTALHTLAVAHGQEGEFLLDQFARNYELTAGTASPEDVEEVHSYLGRVRALSAESTGDESTFERVAQAFIDHPNNGDALKQAIKTVPAYPSTGPFWQARAQLIKESGVSPAFGKQLTPGAAELITLLGRLGKRVAVISNSRSDLVVPALQELMPRNAREFTEIITLGGSDTQQKPAPDAFEDMCRRHPGMVTGNTLYIGNAQEDVRFANNINVPAIIFGQSFEVEGADNQVQFIPDASTLSRVLQRHTDGATIGLHEGSLQYNEIPGSERFVHTMSPAELRVMARTGLRSFWDRHLTQSVEAYESHAWGNDYLSLKHVPDFAGAFGGIMGEIKLDAMPQNPAFAAYYGAGRAYWTRQEMLSLRGESYFAVIDPQYETPARRVDAMVGELKDALTVIESVDRSKLQPEDLLPYVGILDNAKQQALALFNAATYNERNQGIPDDAAYLRMREDLLNVAVATTRTFYEACLGRKFTTPVATADVDSLAERLAPYIDQIPMKGFKLQELDHPLKVMLAAHNIGREDFDTTVGFPSGGTQLAIAAAQANEVIHHKAPRSVHTVIVPLSLHSGVNKGRVFTMTDETLRNTVGLYADAIEGRRVMIVDDNSSTGSTIVRGSEAVSAFGPSSLDARVGEIDPQRMLVRARTAREAGEAALQAVDLRHSVFSAAAGVVPVSTLDIQLRKEHAGRVLNLPSKRKSL